MQYSNPSEKPIALWLSEKVADCADMALQKVWKELAGIGIA